MDINNIKYFAPTQPPIKKLPDPPAEAQPRAGKSPEPKPVTPGDRFRAPSGRDRLERFTPPVQTLALNEGGNAPKHPPVAQTLAVGEGGNAPKQPPVVQTLAVGEGGNAPKQPPMAQTLAVGEGGNAHPLGERVRVGRREVGQWGKESPESEKKKENKRKV